MENKLLKTPSDNLPAELEKAGRIRTDAHFLNIDSVSRIVGSAIAFYYNKGILEKKWANESYRMYRFKKGSRKVMQKIVEKSQVKLTAKQIRELQEETLHSEQ